MSLRDMLRISAGNLWRLKLRSFLTISGVVIAIGAFVSMLSFGAGNQKLVAEQFDDLGLFTTFLVFPSEGEARSDSVQAVLDEEALVDLARIPGVRVAYPYEDFDVTVDFGDSSVTTSAQALPPAAADTRVFSRLAAGTALDPADSTGALVVEDFLDEIGVEPADSLVGRAIVVSVRSVSADSGFAALLSDEDGSVRRRFEQAPADSMRTLSFLRRFVRREAGEAARRFVDGYLHRQVTLSDTLTVRGVLRQGARRARLRSVIIPVSAARRFAAAGPGGEPTELLPALLSGQLFGQASEAARSYSQVTLLLQPWASHPAVSDSVEARGFRGFSYASEFAEIRRFLLFFNLGLAAVGFVALVTASLGIVNTMMMSISERRREIGLLKSLGAEDRDVRFLFLVESAWIGALGAGFGILLGWGVARVASVIAREVMSRQDVPPMELFATPAWLVGTAMLFGIVVSVAAGALPAGRASRVDPVQALRNE